MREIPIFIASSVREFKEGRLELSPFLEMLNKVYKRMDAQLVWNRPETSSRVMNLGGAQLAFDEVIRNSEFFALIVGKSVGPYTRHEYEIALGQFRDTGKPKILPLFLRPLSVESASFLKRIRKGWGIGAQFIDPYDNFDEVKNQLQWELANYVVETALQSDAETNMNRARERIKDKIRGLRAEIEHLAALPMSPETVAEITLTYEEIWRLVRTYRVEPDASLDYMKFLYKQHQYDKAIAVGQWLDSFYTMENPGKTLQARLKYEMAICYHANNQYKQGKKYYLDALELYQSLTSQFPSAYEQNIAIIFGNLGLMSEGKNSINDEGTTVVPYVEKPQFPYEGTKPYIFVSYKREEREKVGNLLDNMWHEGYRIWYDKGTEGSEKWGKTLAEHILNCNVFMLCVSNLSVQSKYCLYELNYAISNDREIFPVYLEETVLPPEWKLWLSPHQSEKLFDYDTVEAFVEQLNQNKKLRSCRVFFANPEPYYQNALNIWQKLALDVPDVLTPKMAYIYNNIGVLLQSTNYVEDSMRHYREALTERYYQKALEIWRQLDNDTYEADFATTCNNLGNLLLHSTQMENAKQYYQEALQIWQRLITANPAAFTPNVAQTCGNLGKLLFYMGNQEEAEQYFREALEIWRHLVEGNHTAFEPYLAITCYNMGEFEFKRGNQAAAKQYFDEAASLYENFPHLEGQAQMCRDALAELQDA